MHPLSLLTLFLLPALNAAQDYGNSGSKSSSSAAAASGSSTASAAAGVHTVAVGQSGLTFSPNSLTAAVGDQIEFHFDSPTHSVAQGDFANACQPSTNASAFWSGFPKDGSPPFTITLNSTDPIWFYCAQVGHCQAGMVGVINPPAGQTVKDFASAAAKASGSKAPSTIQGGVFALAQQGAGASGASSSASASGAAASQGSSGSAAAPKMEACSAVGLVGVLLAGAFMGI